MMNTEELLQKVLQLEERIKVLEMRENKHTSKEKKEDWLNNHIDGIKFKDFYVTIQITDEDIDYLSTENFTNTICHILVNHITRSDSDQHAIWCFNDSKTIYIYNQSWKKLDINDINDLFYHLNTKLLHKLFVWANTHKDAIYNSKKKDSELLAMNAKKLSDAKIYYTDFRKYIHNALTS